MLLNINVYEYLLDSSVRRNSSQETFHPLGEPIIDWSLSKYIVLIGEHHTNTLNSLGKLF